MPDVALTAPEDKHIPEEYEGKLDPNYYCRAWRPEAEAYCAQRAGHGTIHTGEGRCHVHDGGHSKQLIHGGRSRYTKLPARLQDVFESSLTDVEGITNVAPELALARAILADFVQSYDEQRANLEAWAAWYQEENPDSPAPEFKLVPMDKVIKAVKDVAALAQKERKLNQEGMVSMTDFVRYVREMGKRVTYWLDEELELSMEGRLRAIKEDWLKLRLPG